MTDKNINSDSKELDQYHHSNCYQIETIKTTQDKKGNMKFERKIIWEREEEVDG